MLKLNSLVLAFGLISTTSHAAIPVVQLNAKQHQRLEAAQNVLESELGGHLSAEQRNELAILLKEEVREDFVQVADQTRSQAKAIYCVGYNFAGGVSLTRAACVHAWTLMGYQAAFIGVGSVANISGMVFRLVVKFDPTRYAQTFDPVPGQYGVVSQGATLVLGATIFTGDSGNKTLSGGGLNVGLGIDLATISYVIIE